MKRFHILDGLKIGGIENQALTLSSEKCIYEENYLLNLNQEINCYSDKFFNQKKYQNLNIFSLKRKKGILISLTTFKIFKKYKPISIVIYFNNINSLWVVLGARWAGTENIAICVQNAIRDLSIKSLKSIILLKIFNLLNVKLVPCSKAIKISYLKVYRNIEFNNVIPNCINKKYLQEEINSLKKNKRLSKLKTILMIARLDEIKDHETLIKAYSKLQNKCNLILVGDGTKRKKLERITSDLNLNPEKIFLGARLDIPELLAKADIFALSTTLDEGFGIVLIEAMAAGLPIIASDVPACREVLDDGKAGILVAPGRIDLWIKEINRLIDSQKLMEYYKNRSFQNLEKYDVKNVKNQWKGLFKK